MKHGRTEKVQIIVVFGDITGFSNFWDAVTNDDSELIPWLDEFDRLLSAAEADLGHDLTDTGDGFMLTVDLSKGHNCQFAIRLLLVLFDLLKKIEDSLAQKPSPKPDGFRMVLAKGWVLRKVKTDGRIVLRGKHINLAHNALDFARGLGVIAHASFKDLIGDEQAREAGIRFTPMKSPKEMKQFFVCTLERRRRNR